MTTGRISQVLQTLAVASTPPSPGGRTPCWSSAWRRRPHRAGDTSHVLPLRSLDCCVCAGWLNTSDLPERSAQLKDTSAESRTTWEARIRTFWISKSVLSVAPAGCAGVRTTAQLWRRRSISITRCGGSILPQRRMPTTSA